jgi:predicted nuclease of predicted toxin-antitoxin system
MKCLVVAQLPRRFCVWLRESGHDAIHALELPQGNHTSDLEIIRIAESDDRIVVTKDDDFVQSFLVLNRPSRLLLISTGNIPNSALEKLMRANLTNIFDAFSTHRFIEIGRDSLVIHE